MFINHAITTDEELLLLLIFGISLLLLLLLLLFIKTKFPSDTNNECVNNKREILFKTRWVCRLVGQVSKNLSLDLKNFQRFPNLVNI